MALLRDDVLVRMLESCEHRRNGGYEAALPQTSGCARADPVALDQEISWNFPARGDLLEHIDRIKPAPALERPTALLIGFDQRREDIELVALGCAIGCTPKLLDFGESAPV